MIAELRVRGDPHVSPLHCLEEDDEDSGGVSGAAAGGWRRRAGVAGNPTGGLEGSCGCHEPGTPSSTATSGGAAGPPALPWELPWIRAGAPTTGKSQGSAVARGQSTQRVCVCTCLGSKQENPGLGCGGRRAGSRCPGGSRAQSAPRDPGVHSEASAASRGEMTGHGPRGRRPPCSAPPARPPAQPRVAEPCLEPPMLGFRPLAVPPHGVPGAGGRVERGACGPAGTGDAHRRPAPPLPPSGVWRLWERAGGRPGAVGECRGPPSWGPASVAGEHTCGTCSQPGPGRWGQVARPGDAPPPP